ncbi:KPN_02809 family neutral zinc metallopeptidase [Pararhizobium haloflavum]|uniref:KPN_02809 family neutral zinc metallopeptidase n=1 Tax=Pararhizobium haloflavum TaxID=2037914 RepID=UPI000C18DC5D|nr:neutral zinc metallopeptidase [Pararhizobium haloflavum]
MRWRGRRQSSNIDDRRGRGFGGGGRRMRIPMGSVRGGGGIGGIVVLAVFALILWAVGINPMVLFSDGGAGGGSITQTQAPTDGLAPDRRDEHAQFIATVLAETEDTWNGIMEAEGADYPEPTLVLFDGAVESACGQASAAVGPFYCPSDQHVYIDLRFFDELASRFDAAGDFAQAYVVAHEVGHHVQNLIGVLPQFNEMRQGMSEAEANALSVRVELQADCFAGIWGHFTEERGLLEAGDLQEALNAATQIGDDTLQRRTQGYIVPESFNHGSSEQRREWFQRGFETGRLQDCDTFSANL